MKSNRKHTAVALFVRHPLPGYVKTRLACDLGDEAACELYQAMVADIIVNVSACHLPIYLFHDGQHTVGLPKEWLQAAHDVVGQSGDALGERMAAAFEYLFSIDRKQVILIGSDIPGIDTALLQSAVAAMKRADVLFSPAFDGGYCLVASRKDSFNAEIFQNIPWSTAAVLEKTLERCKSAGLKYTLLEPRQDIDTLDDIKAYCNTPSSCATFSNNWLISHGYM